MLNTPAIVEIVTDKPNVFAFTIKSEMTKDDMSALADRMNTAFDIHDDVNMLLNVSTDDLAEGGAWFDVDVFKAQFRAVAKVDRYATIGADGRVGKVIETFSKILPVEAKAFDRHEEALAWDFVGAKPIAA